MGNLYFIGCRDCKIVRDLDKLHILSIATNRNDAIRIMEEGICEGANAFRLTLLASFLSEHRGHSCVFFNEHDEKTMNEDWAEEERGFWDADV